MKLEILDSKVITAPVTGEKVKMITIDGDRWVMESKENEERNRIIRSMRSNRILHNRTFTLPPKVIAPAPTDVSEHFIFHSIERM